MIFYVIKQLPKNWWYWINWILPSCHVLGGHAAGIRLQRCWESRQLSSRMLVTVGTLPTTVTGRWVFTCWKTVAISWMSSLARSWSWNLFRYPWRSLHQSAVAVPHSCGSFVRWRRSRNIFHSRRHYGGGTCWCLHDIVTVHLFNETCLSLLSDLPCHCIRYQLPLAYNALSSDQTS